MKIYINQDKLVIYKRSEIKLIRLNDISYFERINQKTHIFDGVSENEIMIRNSLKELEEILPEGFKRSHRSFIINVNKIIELKMMSNTTYEAFFPNDRQALVSKELIKFII